MPNMPLEKSGEIYSRKNEEMEPKQKQRPVVGVSGVGNKSHAVKSKIV